MRSPKSLLFSGLLRQQRQTPGVGAQEQGAPLTATTAARSKEQSDGPKVLSVVKIKDGMKRSLLEGHNSSIDMPWRTSGLLSTGLLSL